MPDFTIKASNGRTYRVTAPDREAAQAALLAQLNGQASSQPQEGDTSMGTAFNVGSLQAMDLGRTGMATANRALEDSFVGDALNFVNDKVGNPVREALGFDPVDRRANATEAQAAMDAEAARAQGATEDYIQESGFQNMTTGDIDGWGDLARYAGQKVANTAPMMAGAIGSGGMVTYPLSVGELSQNLDEIEGISQEQKDSLALTGGAIMTALENLGLSKLLPKGSNGTILGGIAEGFVTEGTTETLQELVAIGAEAVAGKEFAEGEITSRLRESAAAGAVTGGVVRGGTQTATNLGSSIFNSDGTVVDPDSLQATERQAAASLAQRLRSIADDKGFDLREVTHNGGARSALNAAHTDIATELNTLVRHPAVRQYLDPNQAKTFEDLVENYAAAMAAIKDGRNKVKGEVTQKNFDAIMRLLPPTKEAAEIANLLREGNALTQLFQNGTRGGISQYTDTFLPVYFGNGGYNPAQNISNMGNQVAAIYSGGSTVPFQVGAFVAGRTIDRLTGGRRSPIDRFVRVNEGQETLPTPSGPSLLAARALEAQREAEVKARTEERNARLTEQERELNLDLVRRGAPPAGDINNPDSQSPQFIVENATGLDRSGVARILRIMKANPNTQPAILRAIEGYEKSVAEGGRVPLMTPLIRAIKQFQNTNPEYQGSAPSVDTGGPAQPQAPQFGGQMTSPENYQRGVQDNIDFRENLASELQADETLTPVVKAQVATALDALGMNLGSAPVESVQTIVQGLQAQQVPQEAIDAYVSPYADRVISQQAQRAAQMSMPMSPNAAPDVQSASPAQPPRPRFDQSAPQIGPIRGETTNIPMPNALSSTFEFARDNTVNTGRDFKLRIQERALEAQREEGIDLTTLEPANIDRLADYVVNDAKDALVDNENAIGWYDRTVSDALGTLGELYPEINTDQESRLQFIWALAVTSNGTKVDKNFELAADAYDTLKRTGRFPEKIGIGDAAKQIDAGLQMYHTMLDKFDGDHAALETFMNSQVPVKEIEKTYGVNISGEGKNTTVRGASILGPKIGNGFFSNLYGNFDALTMDRWLMRSVGRWRGTLVKINEPMVKAKKSEIQNTLANMEPQKLKALRDYLKPSGLKIGKKISQTDARKIALYVAKMSTSKPWREGLNEISPEIRLASNALAKYLDGQVEAPAGAKERDFIRAVFSQALERLNKEPTITRRSNQGLTMSDLQALLWYPEKRLYDTAKAPEGQESRGYADDEAPDYANAARKLVEARKAMAGGDRLGRDGGTGRGRGGPSPSDARLSQQAPRGVAGILAQRIAGGPEGQAVPSRNANPPTVPEVKLSAKDVAQKIEVGKRGSPFENGIKDLAAVKRLAEAMNITLLMFDDFKSMQAAIGGNAIDDATRGAFIPERRTAYTMNAGALDGNGTEVSELESFVTSLHEVAHGISSDDFSTGEFSDGYVSKPNYLKEGKRDYAAAYSMEHVIGHLVSDKGAKRNQILAEILHLQKNASIEGMPMREGSQLKNSISALRRAATRRGQDRASFDSEHKDALKSAKDYFEYEVSIPELTVDPMIMYLYDPKTMKRVAPNTAALIKGLFDKANNPKIQFFSHPLAMVVAAIAAMLARQEMADEEEKQMMAQMPAGLLSQQPTSGALTI